MNGFQLGVNEALDLMSEIDKHTEPTAICKKYQINMKIYQDWKSIHHKIISDNLAKMTEIEKENIFLKKKNKLLWIEKNILQETLEGKL